MAQTTLAGYQYVGMKGWAVMAATEYVTIDDLIGGEPLTGTDTITLYAGEGATYSATGADLQQNSYFFPASSYTNSKVTSPATPVPAIIALEWNTGKIETTPDSSALDAVARTAYKPTNLRFAHGLSAANYTALDDCDSMQTGDVCSAMRMLQRVQKIVVTMDVQKDAQITVPAVISGTNATVDSSKMSDALDKLADNGLLTVDASNSSSTGLSFTLPSADVRKLADKNVKLELITALGSVTLDAASLKGFGGGLFRPNAPITREQFVAILYRDAAYKGLQTTASASLSAFADAASVSRLGRRRGPLGRRQRPDERQERPDRPGRPHHQSRSSRPAAPLPGLSKHKKDAPKAPKRAAGASCVMYGRRFSLYDCRRAKRLL